MIEIVDCQQGAEAWYRARMGIPTASMFATVMASGRDGGASKTRRSYMLQLAGEILTGQPAETFSNHHMERGKSMEDEARDLYAFTHDVEPQRVGFIRNGPVGCSPDSLIGAIGMLEVKSALPAILLDKLLRDAFPPEHKAQCQGGLWVAEREWVDIAVYCPGLPLFAKRGWRDDAYIKTISTAVDEFLAELRETVEHVRRYRPAPVSKPAERLSILAAG